jgi:hypothetical protein
MRHGAPATRRSGRVEPFARDAAPKDGETTGAERAEPAIAETLGCLLTRDRIV